MIAYFGILLFLGIGVTIEQINHNKRWRENYFIFSLLLLVLFFGLRGYIGYDWFSYKPNFDNVQNIMEIIKGDRRSLATGYEIGFQIYNSLIKSFTQNYFIYNLINSVVDISILYIVIKRYSKFQLLTLLLFFGVYGVALEIDMIRNFKSILLFLLSIEYIEKRNFPLFLLFNIVGILFHISSILYIPMYFILNIKWNRNIILLLFILGNIYYISNTRIFLTVIKNYYNYLPVGIGTRLNGYFNLIPLDFPLGFSLYYFERMALFLLAWLVSDSLKNKRYGNIMLNSMYISIFFFLYFSEFSIISMRFSLLFIYSYWFIIPMFLEILPKFPVVIFALLLALFRLNNQINFIGSREVYSYQNILFNAKDLNTQLEKIKSASQFKNLGHGKEISLLF